MRNVTDLIALISAAVSLPYLAGFFDWVGFLHVFGISPSEVTLTQADYLLASLNLLPDQRLPPPEAVGALAAFGLLLLGLYITKPATSPASDPDENPTSADNASSMLTQIKARLPSTLVLLAGSWALLAMLAITVGYQSGRDRAISLTEVEGGRSSRTSFLASLQQPAAAASQVRLDTDQDGEIVLLSHPLRSKIVLDDGKTLFLFVPTTDAASNMRGRVMRIPVDRARSHVTIVTRQED